MKKLSISLFAVLAIVFAVSSAFTTPKKAKPFSITFEIWGVSSNVTYSTAIFDDIDQASTKTLLVTGGSAFDFDGAGGGTLISTNYPAQMSYAFSHQDPTSDPEHFSTFNASNSTKNVDCSADGTRVCLGYIKQDTNDTQDQLLAVSTGAYSVVNEQ